MSYASYGVVDRWRWVDGCVHEHVCLPPDNISFSFRACISSHMLTSSLSIVGPRREASAGGQVLQAGYEQDYDSLISRLAWMMFARDCQDREMSDLIRFIKVLCTLIVTSHGACVS